MENIDINNWRNEHGEPDFAYLESLRVDGTIEALEKLQSIALDLDIDFSTTSSVDDLIDMIRSATEKNEDDGDVGDNN